MDIEKKKIFSKVFLLVCAVTAVVITCLLIVGPVLLFLSYKFPLSNWLGQDAAISVINIAFIILAGGIVFFVLLLPILWFLLGKVWLYFSLGFICLFHGYRFQLNRIPFASLGGIKERPDITITTREGKIYLHMLDIVFPYRRSLTMNDKGEYTIVPYLPNRVKRLRGQSGYIMVKSGRAPLINPGVIFSTVDGIQKGNPGKIKKLPQLSPIVGEKHILLVPFLPANAIYTNQRICVSLGSGQKIGTMTFYTAKNLKKGLRKKLHVSIFDEIKEKNHE